MLEELEHQLKDRFPSMSLRGSGDAIFIFIQEASGAVEASVHDGLIWIEFWNDNDESPVVEETFRDVSAARVAILT
ncbi:MAG: hypothetical protein KDA69_00810 [Planctomycetaceae bacterium]|nr:hypothetical protein [Planctomycetaceae bacterium]MCA9042824.1 hypothetical protein [Planctomycetaceae bacterium]